MRAFVLALTFLLSMPAWAGIYLEPYVGYMETTTKSTYTVLGEPVDSTANAHGVGYGGKLGWSFMRAAIGADYMGGTMTSDGSDSSLQNIGAFFQFGLLPLIKFHGTYYFSTQIKGTSDSITTTETGNGFKVGFGFYVFPHMMVNLDYISLHFTKVSGDDSITSIDSTSSGGFVSVSIPLDL